MNCQEYIYTCHKDNSFINRFFLFNLLPKTNNQKKFPPIFFNHGINQHSAVCLSALSPSLWRHFLFDDVTLSACATLLSVSWDSSSLHSNAYFPLLRLSDLQSPAGLWPHSWSSYPSREGETRGWCSADPHCYTARQTGRTHWTPGWGYVSSRGSSSWRYAGRCTAGRSWHRGLSHILE